MDWFPSRKDIDKPLLQGAFLSGAGWTIGGLCPGPALTSLKTGSSSILIFVLFMSIGIFITPQLEVLFRKKNKTTLSLNKENYAVK